MGMRLNVVTLLASLALFACGGGSHGEAKAPESDPWAGYKGTYATAAGASGSPTARMKVAKTEAARTDAKEAPVEVADATPAPAPTPVVSPSPSPAKKAKTGAVKAAAKKKK